MKTMKEKMDSEEFKELGELLSILNLAHTQAEKDWPSMVPKIVKWKKMTNRKMDMILQSE